MKIYIRSALLILGLGSVTCFAGAPAQNNSSGNSDQEEGDDTAQQDEQAESPSNTMNRPDMERPDMERPPMERPEQQFPEEQACTQEAKNLCVATGEGDELSYQTVSVGRLGPNCEFPWLPAEVETDLCIGSIAPEEPILCTADARSYCVATEEGAYLTIELGRLGPNCDFPFLPSEVDATFCLKDPGNNPDQGDGGSTDQDDTTR